MVYFWIKLDEKNNSVAFQANLFIPNVWQLQCNNVPHETCNNLPHGGIFVRNTYPSNTLAHKAVLIPPIYPYIYYSLGICFIFLSCKFSVVAGYVWRNMNFRKCKKFTRGGKHHFLAITFSYWRLYHLQISHAELIWHTFSSFHTI